jgi:hypothetical protein
MPPGSDPHRCWVIAGLVFVLSHNEYSSLRQYQQRPQTMNEHTTTRSPGRCLDMHNAAKGQ